MFDPANPKPPVPGQPIRKDPNPPARPAHVPTVKENFPKHNPNPEFTIDPNKEKYPDGTYQKGMSPDGTYPNGTFSNGKLPSVMLPDGRYPDTSYPNTNNPNTPSPAYPAGPHTKGPYPDGVFPNGVYPNTQPASLFGTDAIKGVPAPHTFVGSPTPTPGPRHGEAALPVAPAATIASNTSRVGAFNYPAGDPRNAYGPNSPNYDARLDVNSPKYDATFAAKYKYPAGSQKRIL